MADSKEKQFTQIADAVAERQGKSFADLKVSIDAILAKLETMEKLQGGAKKGPKTVKAGSETPANGTSEKKEKPKGEVKAPNSMNWFKTQFVEDSKTRDENWKAEWENEVKANKKYNANWEKLVKDNKTKELDKKRAAFVWNEKKNGDDAFKKVWKEKAAAAAKSGASTASLEADS